MPNNDLVLLGKRIKEIRSRQNLSQERLSESCGISSRHISEIERGESNPSYQVLRQISFSLQTPISSLFEFEHHKDEAGIRAELITMIQSLPPSKLRLLYRITTALND